MKTITLSIAVLFTAMASAQCLQKVVSGNQYYLAISQDGSLWGWGENSNSQLGDGTTTDRTTPVQINTGSWRSVTAGTTHSLGIKRDGTLWAWGSDSGGKLGNGASGNITFPMQIGTATDWKEVYAGEIATIAIKNDGTLWGWGWNTNYFLGNGQATNYISQIPVQIGTDTNWSTMSAKGWSCLAIKTNGQLWGWGENSLGQLGKGDNIDTQTPVQIGTGINWLRITNNERLSFAIKTDHTLWGWGTQTNGSDYLGLNAIYSPLQIGTSTDWESVSVKPVSINDYVLLIKTNHTLWAWGSDTAEQLGNGTLNSNYTVPTQIGTETNWVSATAGTAQSSAVKMNGTFWVWGNTALVGSGIGNTAVPTAYACNSLAVDEMEKVEIGLYPNPTSNKLHIVSEGEVISVQLSDINGRIFETKLLDNTIDVANLCSGIYLVRLETLQGFSTKKIIKK